MTGASLLQHLNGHPPVFRLQQFYALPESGRRLEVFDGQVVEAEPPAVRHQLVAHNLGKLLCPYTHRARLGRVYFFPFPCYLSLGHILAPDVVFVGRSRLSRVNEVEHHMLGGPHLIVHLFSNGFPDLERRVRVLAAHGVNEFWAINASNKSVRQFTRTARGLYRDEGDFRVDDAFVSPALKGLRLRVRDLFAIPTVLNWVRWREE